MPVCPGCRNGGKPLTLVECQNELPYLRLLSADPVQALNVQSNGLYELQTLVDDDGNTCTGQLLL